LSGSEPVADLLADSAFEADQPAIAAAGIAIWC
jgi:hypothetical protein